MSTYIVEVDSTYRDLNKYPSQTDFAVSFETNSSTNYEVQGKPLFSDQSDPYYNNFFNKCSIDPDYEFSNLSVTNGNIIDVQKNNSTYYVSGIAFAPSSGVIFSINNNSGTMVNYTGVNVLSPYLCSLTQNVDNNFTFNWLVITVGTGAQGVFFSPSGSNFFSFPAQTIWETPYSGRSISRLSNQGGIFWGFDFNYTSFDIYQINSSKTQTSLYSIVSPTNDFTFSVQLGFFAFDSIGNPYFINNRPWGYHIVNSTFKLTNIQGIENSKFGFVIDEAENLFLNGNFNQYSVSFVSQVATGANSLSRGNFFADYAEQTNLIYLNMTGSTGSQTGGTGPLREFFCYVTTSGNGFTVASVGSTIAIFESSPNLLTDFTYRQSIDLKPFMTSGAFTGTTTPGYHWSEFGTWTNYNNFTYYFGAPSLNTYNPSQGFPLYGFKVDPIGMTVTNVAKSSTPYLFNRTGISGVRVGTNLYLPVRSTSNTIFLYNFDLLTDTLSLLTSCVLTGASNSNTNQTYATTYNIVSPDKIILFSPDISSTSTTTSVYSNTRVLWVLEYTITTNSISIVSNSSILPQTFYKLQIVNIKSDWFLSIDYLLGVYFININDYKNLVYTTSYPEKMYISNIKSYTDITSNKTNYYLNINQAGAYTSLININDINNITPQSINVTTLSEQVNPIITTRGFNVTYMTSLTTGGYCYGGYAGNSLVGAYPVITKLRFPMAEPKINSYHYYKNINSTTNLPNSDFSKFGIGYLSKTSSSSSGIIITADFSSYYIYTINNLFSISLLLNNSLPLTQTETPLNIKVFTNTQDTISNNGIYFGIVYSSVCYVYYTSFTNVSPVLIGSIPGTSLIDIDFGYTQYANIPGLYLFVCQRDGQVRKYSVSSSTITLLNTATFKYNNASYVTWSCLFCYLNNINTYVLYTQGNTVPNTNLGFNQIRGIYVTEPGDFSATTPTNIAAQSSGLSIDSIKLVPYLIQKSTNFVPTLFPSWFGVGLTTSRPATLAPTTILGIGSLSSIGSYLRPPSSGISWTDPLTSQIYVGFPTNGQKFLNDSITITNLTTYANIYSIDGTLSININGNIQDMNIFQSGTRTIIINLIKPGYTGAGYTGGSSPTTGSSSGPNSFYFYDVSNYNFAIKYQNNTEIVKRYNNIQAHGGGGFVHSVSNDGIPQWLSVVGGVMDPDVLSINNSINSIDIDDKNNLYTSGSWSSRLDMYQSFNGNDIQTSIIPYPTNSFTVSNTNYNGFIAKLNLQYGEWQWVAPIIGNQVVNMQRIRYITSTNSLLNCMNYSSTNLFLYDPQPSIVPSPTGIFNLIRNTQSYFNNKSSSSSSVFILNTDGMVEWVSSLFSNVPNTYVNVTSNFVDSVTNKIIVSGISNTPLLEGTDDNNNEIQILYAKIDQFSQMYNFIYQYSITGSYLYSNYIVFSPFSIVQNENVRCYPETNHIMTFNQVNPNVATGTINIYNRDSTLGGKVIIPPTLTTVLASTYKLDPIFKDTNTLQYSTVYVYDFTGPTGSLSNHFANYFIYLQGNKNDILLNNNFVIRDSVYENQFKIILNQVIDVSKLIRNFSTINNITGSDQYYSSNISISELYSVGLWYTGTSTSLTFSTIFGRSTNNIDISKEYYFMFPQQQTGGTGYYTSIVPITNISFNSSSLEYIFTVNNINDLRVPSPSGTIYGPYIDIVQKNYSAFYSLQWYPGSRLYRQSYLVGLYDLIIPNRPIRNSRYPGIRTLLDYPYIYLVIYNSDDQDNFNPSIINSVYDNNVNVPRFALFQIPTTSFNTFTSDSNYFTASSSATPRILFSPGFYKMTFKLCDDRGNVLIFDNTPFKETDNIFKGGVVPNELLNITVRLAFKKS